VTTSTRTIPHDSHGPPNPTGVEGPRRNLMLIIWRRRGWVVATVIIGVAASAVYLSKQVPIYASSSRLLIQGGASPKAITDNNGPTPQLNINNACELIKSTHFLAQVADREEIKSMKTLRGYDVPVNAIKSNLTVVPAANADIVTITYESPYRDEAATMVNSIVDAYSAYMQSQRHTSAVETLKSFSVEKDKLEKEVSEKRSNLLAFKQSHGILSFQDERGNIVSQSLAKISEVLTTARIETIDAKAAYDGIKQIAGDPKKVLQLARADQAKDTIVNIDRDVIPTDTVSRSPDQVDPFRTELYQDEERLAKLLRQHDDSYPDVKDAKADVEFMKQQVAKHDKEVADYQKLVAGRQRQLFTEQKQQAALLDLDKDQQIVDSYIAGVARKLTVAQQREAELSKSFEDQKKQAFDLNAVAAEYASKDAELAMASNLYTVLAQRIRDINVNEDTAADVTVGILDVARAGSQVKPVPATIFGIGLILGLSLGVGIAFLLDLMDHRISSIDEVMSILDAQVLGLVPHIKGKETASQRGRKVSLEPTSDVAEAYRTIRTAVYFGASTEIKKLLVTSPAPGDGKSTSASNLAIAMAQAGRRVALIDCDLRRPTVHKIFELEVTTGLADVMAGGPALRSAIYPSGIDRLDIVPCGKIPSNPSEILNSDRFSTVLGVLVKHYDLLIIDSPPIAPVSDARILGALCDATILVLRAERSTRQLIAHARDGLANVGAQLIGAIVNDVPRRRDRYGYYYGYGYGHRYQYGYGNEKADTKARSSGKQNGKALAELDVDTQSVS
jgi:succinoglycan biosynthesis transport protein ExoP